MEDYEIINILGSCLSSATFKAKNKLDDTVCVLKGIALENCDDAQKKLLMKNLQSRKELRHPNVLKINGIVEQSDANVLYLVEEYCGYGSLKNFIQEECVAKGRYLHEDLLFRILYQIAIALRTIDSFMGQLCVDNIFLDADYNVKLYNFYADFKYSKQKQPKMTHLGIVLYELCVLKRFDKLAWEKDLNQLEHLNTIAAVIINLIKDNTDTKKNINKILCHPTVLIKSSQWSKDKCFVTVESPKTLPKTEEVTLSDKLELLRSKERALKVKEQNLLERERTLENREKKLLIMERTLKEKLQQAEVYLKRCRLSKQSVSSGSSKSSIHSQTKTMSYEDFDDGTYASCGDSVIEPPAKPIAEKKTFTRTLSERKIRFKTSPLKENGFNRKMNWRRTVRHSRIMEESNEVAKEKLCSRRKSLVYENDFVIMNNELYGNEKDGAGVGWTDETKKQAFELLRMMNSDKENLEVKHTYL